MPELHITEVLRGAGPVRRTIAEVLALIPDDGSALMDAGFARDVAAAIEAHREPLEQTWE